MAVAVDSLDLPEHILLVIAEKLFINIKDYIRFGAVCRSWRSLYTQHQTTFPPQPPLLMLPSSELLAINDQQTCFPHQSYYPGSAHGWLISLTSTSPPLVAHLFNPFLSSSINLPPLSNYYFIEDETDCAPQAFFYKRLAFCKPCDNAWTCLELHPDSKNFPWRLDLGYMPCSLTDPTIYFENKFYTVDSFGALWLIDLDAPHPRLSNLLPTFESSFPGNSKHYVVQSSSHLLQVTRISHVHDDFSNYTTKFHVFKLDQTHSKRVETKNLYRQMLLLGSNASMSLPASDYPGCKANCIYFTDDYIEGYHHDGGDIDVTPGPPDMGVFNLEDGSTEPHYQVRESRQFHPAPIWIEPT
ncbi:hypothetical protein AQUCO_02200081v1 [Aquilegia coerulea]|uniref:KIB1-4 beta-propeller domain-containing protein n=1 Tax=Aquilegia coerulea TaxID=218851 RepID=A0A2G5DD13_AQUCA|nr:hypothetical protein AQUCO_02200081v1 [Aquilegia coerulea]